MTIETIMDSCYQPNWTQLLQLYPMLIFSVYVHLLAGAEFFADSCVFTGGVHIDSVMYDPERMIPLIRDFKRAVLLETETNDEVAFMKKICNVDVLNVFMPLEAHILSFMKKSIDPSISLSYTNITDVCACVSKNLAALRFVSEDFIMAYEELCVQVCEANFVGCTVGEVIAKVKAQKMHLTWDTYAVHIFQVHLLKASIYESGCEKFCADAILKGIHPNASRRPTAKSVLEILKDQKNTLLTNAATSRLS